MALEIHAIAVVSTAHVSENAMVSLSSDLHPAIFSREYGVMFPSSLDYSEHAEIEGAVRPIINAVKDLHPSASFIMLDRDADLLDGLAVYHW